MRIIVYVWDRNSHLLVASPNAAIRRPLLARASGASTRDSIGRRNIAEIPNTRPDMAAAPSIPHATRSAVPRDTSSPRPRHSPDQDKAVGHTRLQAEAADQ